MNEFKIILKLYGGLYKNIKNYDHKKGLTFELNSNQTLTDIIEKIGIPKSRISLLLSNDKVVDSNYKLKNYDLLKIYFPMGGG